MILLNANAELKAVFQRVIKNMGVNVTWDGVFAVTFNNLILLGKVRSLFFNFDNKKAFTNLIDIPVSEEILVETADHANLSNAINMTLYAFGKWGAIKGLKVEQDYVKLNDLFRSILKEIKVEPSFRDDNFRFYKDKVQITYEDTIQEILDLAKGEMPEVEKEEEQSEGITSEEESEGHKLGLWHNMNWKIASFSFRKAEREEEDAAKSRLGHDFYMVNYQCPTCGEKLYMVLYPLNREFLIETEEARVYLARAYACNTCNCFFTPRPEKLLQEGDVYVLDFDDDRNAYEDYLELLGREGSGSANYKFNEYESERNKSDPPKTLEETCAAIDTMSEEELNEVKEKMHSGFYSQPEVEKYNKTVERELHIKESKGTKAGGKEGKKKEQDVSAKTAGESKEIAANITNESYGDKEKTEVLTKQRKEKYDAHMAVLERMSKKQLDDLKVKIHSEQMLDENEKKNYLQQIDQVYYRQEEKEMEQKAEACKDKSYAEIARTIEEIKNGNASNSLKEMLLNSLFESKKSRGEKEVDSLISHMPAEMNKKQIQLFQEKLAQYEEIDTTAIVKQLDERMDMAEQLEIKDFIKRANKRDRNSLLRLQDQLKEQGFADRNVTPFLEKIHDKVYEMDEAAIRKICPDILGITFEDGLKAYEEIASGIFLPELKISTLEMLDKRLTKIKMDENEQLVKKLQKEMDKSVKDASKLYFYESRKMMRGDMDENEEKVINRALNTYASSRNKYEYPILISDASRFPNGNIPGGKEGFVLTPDHIFYNNLWNAGSIPIMEVEDVAANTGLINKGVYVNRKTGKKIKIPIKINSSEWKAVAECISRFISYLQEKPESRNVSYLEKERHAVKCCYRCGYTFTNGDTCPQCGSKANH